MLSPCGVSACTASGGDDDLEKALALSMQGSSHAGGNGMANATASFRWTDTMRMRGLRCLGVHLHRHIIHTPSHPGDRRCRSRERGRYEISQQLMPPPSRH